MEGCVFRRTGTGGSNAISASASFLHGKPNSTFLSLAFDLCTVVPTNCMGEMIRTLVSLGCAE
jgi:hypothetical protein